MNLLLQTPLELSSFSSVLQKEATVTWVLFQGKLFVGAEELLMINL